MNSLHTCSAAICGLHPCCVWRCQLYWRPVIQPGQDQLCAVFRGWPILDYPSEDRATLTAPRFDLCCLVPFSRQQSELSLAPDQRYRGATARTLPCLRHPRAVHPGWFSLSISRGIKTPLISRNSARYLWLQGFKNKRNKARNVTCLRAHLPLPACHVLGITSHLTAVGRGLNWILSLQKSMDCPLTG